MKREFYYRIQVVAFSVLGLLAAALVWASLSTPEGNFVLTTGGIVWLVVSPLAVVSAIRRKELTFCLPLPVRPSILLACFLIALSIYFIQLVSPETLEGPDTPELPVVLIVNGLTILVLLAFLTFGVLAASVRDADFLDDFRPLGPSLSRGHSAMLTIWGHGAIGAGASHRRGVGA